MIPPNYSFSKQPITSNGARNVWRYSVNYNFNLNARIRYLAIVKRSWGGRNCSGIRILRTRGAMRLKIRHAKINFHFKILTLAFVADFTVDVYRNKFISLIYLANGALMYLNSMTNHRLFRYVKFYKKSQTSRSRFLRWFAPLIGMKKLSEISVIELTPGRGAQYIRGPGSRGRLFAFEMWRRAAVITLPSKLKKFFSAYSSAGTSRLMGEENKKFKNTKAGFWQKLGYKSIVRGVAMNPVDHPHGGRTKAIKYQRTPWGKTTKLK